MDFHCILTEIRNPVLVLAIVLQFLGYVNTQSTLSFCDGEDLFVINENDCHGGINFGYRKPECVCISGVYRSWTEDCGLYDGFIHEYCSPLWDKNYDVQGLRLISGVFDVFKDTVAVFGENGSDYTSWKAYGRGQNGKTASETFYTLNGFPVMLMKQNDKFICVEPTERVGKQVCRFFATDNRGLWEPDKEVRILVMDNCDPTMVSEIKGYKVAELKEHRCYDILDRNASECRLPCQGKKANYIPGSVSSRDKKSVDNEIGGDSMMTSGSEVALPIQTAEQTNNNFFLHRKLNKYTRLRQTGRLPKPDLGQTAPNRTFALLDIAKRIVRQYCPVEFVSDYFLDQALELFVVLHKGNDFRYIEDVPQRDFHWIKDILLSCRSKDFSNVARFYGMSGSSSSCSHEDFIGSNCFQIQDYFTCRDVGRGDFHLRGKYHFVVDAIWQIIDLTHVLCYPTFAKSYRMYHVWEQASEKLFTRDIRNLWTSPQIDMIIYNALLSNRAVVDMVNLERCSEAAYNLWIMPELVRPPVQRSIFRRRKRAVEPEKSQSSVAKSVDVFCAKEKDEVEYKC